MAESAHYTSTALTSELTNLRSKTKRLIGAMEFLLELIDAPGYSIVSIGALSDSKTIAEIRKALAQAKAAL